MQTAVPTKAQHRTPGESPSLGSGLTTAQTKQKELLTFRALLVPWLDIAVWVDGACVGPSFSKPGLILCHTDSVARGSWPAVSFPSAEGCVEDAGQLKVSSASFYLILHDLSKDRAPGNPCSLTSSPSFLLLQVHPAFPGWGRAPSPQPGLL